MGDDEYIKGVSVVIGPLLPAYIDAEAYLRYHKKVFDSVVDAGFAVVARQVYTSYFSKEEMDRIQTSINNGGFDKIKSNIAFFYHGLKGVKEWIEKNKDVQPEKLCDDELLDVFQEFIQISEPPAPSIPYMRYAEVIVYNKLSEEIKKQGVVEKLTVPDDIESVIIKEKRHLYKCVYEILIKKASVNDKVKEHLEQFGWSTTHFSMDKPLDKKDVKDALYQLLKKKPGEVKKEVDELRNYLKDINNQKKGLAQKIMLSEKDKESVKILEDFARIKILIQDVQSHSIYVFLRFLYEIAKRITISGEDVKWLLPQEITGLLKNQKKTDKTLFDKIRSRKEIYVLAVIGSKLEFMEDERAREFLKNIGTEKSDVNELKGQTGYKGCVKGKAVVVTDRKEFDKVKKGDILVTTTTTPQFIPLVKKVRAIVADSGGITSHAAILSREMKIPCVIGTGIATDVFKDGDLIEVDADKGIVKKWKK